VADDAGARGTHPGLVHHRARRSAVLWTLACVLAASPARARAQPAPAPPADARPWAAGVSGAEQATALELYVAGNREFTESRYAQALTRYREAIQHWDHPAIRFNMAVCFILLDQPVEARDNVERSLAYGAAALDATRYSQGLTYRKLLDASLAHARITCPEAGAEVTLDGKRLLLGPGTADQYLLPGQHQIVATKPGFQTASRTFAAAQGTLTTYEIQPTLEVKAAEPPGPRWRYWKYLVGGGGALIAVGAASYFVARNSFAAYDRDVDTHCQDGCDPAAVRAATDLTAKRGRAELEQTVAFTAFAIGGAAVVAAAIGLVVDQPREPKRPVPVVPVVGAAPGGATLALRWRF